MRSKRAKSAGAASGGGNAIKRGQHHLTKGGPAGANQGGAKRGSSRLDPSHARTRAKKDRSKK